MPHELVFLLASPWLDVDDVKPVSNCSRGLRAQREASLRAVLAEQRYAWEDAATASDRLCGRRALLRDVAENPLLSEAQRAQLAQEIGGHAPRPLGLSVYVRECFRRVMQVRVHPEALAALRRGRTLWKAVHLEHDFVLRVRNWHSVALERQGVVAGLVCLETGYMFIYKAPLEALCVYFSHPSYLSHVLTDLLAKGRWCPRLLSWTSP